MALGEGTSRNFNIRGAQNRVNEILRTCSSKVNLSGANGNVIMSGWKDGNLTMKDEKRRHCARNYFAIEEMDQVKDVRPQRSTRNSRSDVV